MNADGKLVTSAGLILQPEISFPNDIDEINIDQEGRVTGRVAGSSTTVTFGQIQLAKFVNPSGLSSQGGNVLRETDASGSATVAPPGSNGLGLLQQGFIERSNVEIVNELVNLIVAQRAYEVNSRSIQASDQMLSTATSIVR
jgi:flagellar basal-body rod protein FlgG